MFRFTDKMIYRNGEEYANVKYWEEKGDQLVFHVLMISDNKHIDNKPSKIVIDHPDSCVRTGTN